MNPTVTEQQEIDWTNDEAVVKAWAKALNANLSELHQFPMTWRNLRLRTSCALWEKDNRPVAAPPEQEGDENGHADSDSNSVGMDSARGLGNGNVSPVAPAPEGKEGHDGHKLDECGRCERCGIGWPDWFATLCGMPAPKVEGVDPDEREIERTVHQLRVPETARPYAIAAFNAGCRYARASLSKGVSAANETDNEVLKLLRLAKEALNYLGDRGEWRVSEDGFVVEGYARQIARFMAFAANPERIIRLLNKYAKPVAGEEVEGA